MSTPKSCIAERVFNVPLSITMADSLLEAHLLSVVDSQNSVVETLVPMPGARRLRKKR